MAVHAGSWGGLPDFSITEGIAKLLGEKFTSQGGSDLSRSWAAQNTSNTAPTLGTSLQTGGATSSWQPDSVVVKNVAVPSNTPTVPVNNTPSNPNNDPGLQAYNAEIENLYKGGQDILNQQLSNLNDQKATAVSGLDSQTQYLRDQLTNSTNDLKNQIGAQQTALYEGNRSALGEALRTYNNLQQQTQSRYGGSTGAGQFISELLNSEYMRGKFNQNTSYQSAMKSLYDYSNKVESESLAEFNRINREYQNGLKEIDNQYMARKGEIETQKFALEQNKATQRAEAIRSWIDTQNQLKAAREEALFNLQTWREQQNAGIASTVNTLNSNWLNTLSANQGNMENATTATPFSQFGGGTTADNTVAYKYPTSRYSTNPDDNTGDIFDPSQYFLA